MRKRTILRGAMASLIFGSVLNASFCLAQHNRTIQPKQGQAQSVSTHESAIPGFPSSYTYTLFDAPGTLSSTGYGLNVSAKGKNLLVVGCYGPAGSLGATDYRLQQSSAKGAYNESYRVVQYPGVPQQCAFGINATGQIVGDYIDSSSAWHGWQFSAGKYTTVDVSFTGAVGTTLVGINDSGEITGSWWLSDGINHGYSASGGAYTSFDYPGATSTWVYSINNKGDIVGYYTDTSDVTHGFLLSVGVYTSIDPPGALETFAEGVDDNGDVVGTYCTTSPCIDTLAGAEGFLLSAGTYTTVNISGSSHTELSNINDKGWLLGEYVEQGSGSYHTFLAVP